MIPKACRTKRPPEDNHTCGIPFRSHGTTRTNMAAELMSKFEYGRAGLALGRVMTFLEVEFEGKPAGEAGLTQRTSVADV